MISRILLCFYALSVSGCGSANLQLMKGADAAGKGGDYAKQAMILRSLAAPRNAGAKLLFGNEALGEYAVAQVNLGLMYFNGQGVTRDYKEAARLLGLAAAQGNPRGQFVLGALYYDGVGVTQDYKEAARMYGLAAAQGNANAQYNLGVMYDAGRGVTQDYKEAARLYGLAAAQGNAEGRAKVVAIETAFATQAAEALAKTRELDAEAEAQAQVKDAAECKSFGAAVGSPAYVQCRVSLKALRQGVLDNQQKAAQDNARAGELKAQSEQQQLQAAAQQAAAKEAAAVQTGILDAMERRQDDANNAAILQGVLDGLNRNKPKLRCRTTGSETNCF